MPVVMIVGVDHIGSGHIIANAHAVGKRPPNCQTGFYSAQTFPISELGENHRREVVVRTKRFRRSWHRKLRRCAGHLGGILAGHDLCDECWCVVHFRAGLARIALSRARSKTPCLLRYLMDLATMQNSNQFLTGQP